MKLTDTRIWPFRYCDNAERRAAYEATTNDIAIDMIDIRPLTETANAHPWKWLCSKPKEINVRIPHARK
jgi:hypothetical protein